MARPSQKKIKGFATNIVELRTDASAVANDPLIVQTDHDRGSISLDLRQFEEGTLDEIRYPLVQNRFSGRPTLIAQLAPHIQSRYGNKSKTTAENLIPILRRWWVFFDSIADEQRVNTFKDIDDFIGLKQARIKAFAGNYRTDFLRLINDVRTKNGLPPLYWPSQDDEGSASALPHFPHVKLIYHELKNHMKLVMERWKRADELAVTGKDLSGGLGGRRGRNLGYWTDADAHATYRGAIARLDFPIATHDQLKVLLARTSSASVRDVADAIDGLYPRILDTQYLLFLFLLRTGWNATTALEIDVDNYFTDHPTSDAHHMVWSIKNRGRTKQVAIGLNKSQFSPGNILRALIVRTAPLRNFLRGQLAELESQLDELKATVDPAGEDDIHKRITDIRERVRELRLKVKSPWLYATRNGTVGFLKQTNYLPVRDGDITGSGLKAIITKLNRGRPHNDLIDVDMSVGDFRDAYISFAYESSGYSWLVAKLAAGHHGLESLRTYLRKRHWKAHGEKKVRVWGEALWSEIKIHRSVDPAILFARVQRGEISDEERTRWMRRTHVGTGCDNFDSPPKYIAPEHVEGSGCRVQRCALCHHAVLFDDSYDHLARRLMELTHLQETTPLLAWMQSSFPIEMENTEHALKQFDIAKVAERKRYWLEEIKSGRHIPVSFEGAY